VLAGLEFNDRLAGVVWRALQRAKKATRPLAQKTN
jgi:hypothetical protein